MVPDAVHRPERLRSALLFFLALIPAIGTAAIIHRWGVNVPYADEWSNLTLVEKWDTEELAFADLIRAHNGHRIFFPRLIYLVFAALFHGNLRAEMFFSLFLCCLTSAGFLLLLRRTMNAATPRVFAVWALINLFLFSPIQAENWLWGFQLQIFLSNLCLIGVIAGLSAGSRSLLWFAVALASAVIGTFSFGNGLLLWPVGAVLLFCRADGRRRAIDWIGVGLFTVCAYFLGYHAENLSGLSSQWLDYPLFFLAFLGAPLARIPNANPLVLPVIIGAVLTGMYAGAVVYCFRRRTLQKQAVWLAPGAYAIGSALLATATRTNFGVRHALDSRYTTIATLLLLSLIGLVAVLVLERPLIRRRTGVILGVSVLLVLYGVNLRFAFRYLEVHRDFRSQGKGALQFSKITDAEEIVRETLLIRENPQIMEQYLATLDRRQFALPARRDTANLRDAEDRPQRSTEEYGTFESLKPGGANTFVATGWAYLPGDNRAAACVILAAGHGNDWYAIALSDRRAHRADVLAKTGSTGHDLGWSGTVSLSRLAPGKTEITAWALNADTGETFRLPGSFVVEK